MVEIMSSDLPYGDPATRRRILDAAVDLAAELGPSMRLADVSQAAGISHQGLYLHFRGRDALLLAMLPHMEASFELKNKHQQILRAASGLEALDRMVGFMAELNLRLDTIGWVFEEAQYLDDAFGRDYRRRVSGLREAIQDGVTARLAREGLMDQRWTVSDATDLFLATTTYGSWRDLTRELGWTTEQYTESVGRLLRTALLDDPGPV